MAATAAFSIQILSSDTSIQKVCHETLSHVYPGIRFSTTSKEAEILRTTADLVVIDGTHLSKERLEGIAGQLPDRPALIVVPDMTAVRSLRHLLSARRDLIAKSDLGGLSMIQAVHHLRERQLLHEQLQKAAHKLKDASIRDDLTRLYNHHHFNELLEQETKKALRYNRPLSLIIVDIKNFASVNEAYGHAEGDKILAKTANIVRATVREVDIAARFGDNAFAVILPESDMTAAQRAGERLMDALEVIKKNHEKAESKMSICIGVASLAREIETKEDLLRSTLTALAESKKKGVICTVGDITNGREITENRHLIEQLHERLIVIGREAERTAFQSVLKLISEIPFQKKHLVAHSERVAFFAERLANKLGQMNGSAQVVHRAGLLHDIGKLAIDADILNKVTKLTVEEIDILHGHPLFGMQMIQDVPFLYRETECILGHHERFDGKGYPSGKKATDVPLCARIISIAEAWDTMISPQPYRPTPLSLDAALSELKKNAGKQFDPELVEVFSTLITG